MQHHQKDDDILRWLTSIEYHSQQHDFNCQRQSGTGQWLLDSEEFQAWLNATKQTLFCYGIPGGGKTFLTSIVIEDLCRRYRRDETTQTAYVYCNFRRQDDQKVDDLLNSLLKQLAQGHLPLPAIVRDLYHEHQPRNTRPSQEDLMRALHSVIASSSKTFIILDALDELSDVCRLKLLPRIFKFQANTNLNVFITSRPTLDVEKEFQECISCKSLEIRATDEDVENYLENRFSELKVSVSGIFRKEIKEGISKAAEGMYVLPRLSEKPDYHY
jgi:Cdc6-like AAA superfamily ATPase